MTDETPFCILCTGDVHLGRRPSRVPIEDETLGVSHVWEAFVDAVLDRDADAVVLTGDVVDSENKMYEAFGSLERGVRRLLGQRIPVVAVAGNHDHDALPRLVRAIEHDNLHLLGRGGTWESVEVESGSRTVRFVGWSFPAAAVPASPLDDLDLEARSIPTVGVLHCDAGRDESRYAPVHRDALGREPVDAWLLGHIHAPDRRRDDDQLQLYPGSLQPLDPGESGVHGAWTVDIDGRGRAEAGQLPLASLRYEPVTVDVSGVETPEEAEAAVLDRLQDRLHGLADRHASLRHVAYRLRLEGRTRLTADLEALARGLVEDLNLSSGTAEATVEGTRIDVRPDHDLEALAGGSGPAGILAEVLLDLESGDEIADETRRLLRSAETALAKVHDSGGYEPLRRESDTADPPDRDEVRCHLLRQGYRLLDAIQTAGD